MPQATDELIYLTAPIVKIEKDAKEDCLYVYGKATGPDLDLDHQIIDLEFAKRACTEWFNNWANVRQMHSTNLPPAGVAVEMDAKDDGIYLKAKVVEPVAMRLVREGAYKAFSIGIAMPRIVRDPIAKNGRVVDGRVAEFSLVDNPALPSAKFAVVKSAEDGNLDWIGKAFFRNEEGGWTEQMTDASNKAAASDDVSERAHTDILNHVHQHADGTRHSHPHKHAEGQADHDDEAHGHDVAKADLAATIERLIEAKLADLLPQHGVLKRDVDPNVGGGVDRDELKDSDFVFPDERVFPIVTPGDVSDAVSSWGRYKGDKSFEEFKQRLIALAERKGDAYVRELPQAWKEEKKSARQELIKPLHDALCAAYAWDAVKAAHPELAKNGLAAALGPTTQNLLYQMLCNECAEDGGTGSESHDIKELACAYHALVCFLQDEADEMVMLAAREELHKDFAQVNDLIGGWSGGGAGNPPKPTDPLPPPSRFKRPFIQTGHYQQNATNSNPSKPSAARVPEPEDFHRGYLTEGHAADSPANKAVGPDLTDLAASIATALGISAEEAHKHLAELNVKAQDPTRPGPNRSARTYYSNAAKEQTRSALQAIHDHLARLFPDLCPMDNAAGDTQPAEVKASSVPQEITPPPSPPSPGEKAVQPDLHKVDGHESAREVSHDIALLVKAAVSVELEQRVARLREEYEAERQQDRAKIAELEATVDRLGRQPNTAEAPYRSAAPGPVIGVAKSQKAAMPADRYRQWLEQMISAPDSQTAAHAREALRSLGVNPAS